MREVCIESFGGVYEMWVGGPGWTDGRGECR